MDASASPTKSNLKGVYGFLIEIENSAFKNAVKHKNTVIKYTKLPHFDIDSEVPWVEKKSQVQVRTRRTAAIEESPVFTTRSLKADLLSPHRLSNNNTAKRKIVTIDEDDETDLHPKFTREVRKANSLRKTANKSVEAEHKNDKQVSQRTTSRLTSSSKYSKESKQSAKNNVNTKRDCNTHKVNSRNKFLNTNQPQEVIKNAKNEKETVRSRNNKSPTKISVGKNITPRESDKEFVLKNKDGKKESFKSSNVMKKPLERSNTKSNQSLKRNSLLKEINKHKPVTIIHVPLDSKYSNKNEPFDSNYYDDAEEHVSHKALMYPILNDVISKVDSSTEVDHGFDSKDAITETNVHFITDDKVTQVDDTKIMCESINTHTNLDTAFDSLAIPNVTLTKDKSNSKEDIVNFHSKSLPNLQVPLLKVTSLNNNRKSDSAFHNNASYIISHATVTCTTRQKINFHVVEKNNSETLSNQSSSPMTYPMNVVSIVRKELKKKDLLDKSIKHRDKSNVGCTNGPNELQPLNCPNVVNRNKLVKPSDIISAIRVNTGLLQSDFILCEQFQRELNFIDSFFESLQYLENCSLSDKCFSEKKVKSLFNTSSYNVGLSEYSSFLSKLENGANVCESETMASKSLCLLNLLIRDEQRRAKNLLFVLKMREDALKDFTKSQILWLEKKKKQDNIDISTLKKKQRGALLKLHHECGEMQRMRKALLTQSEKRKIALMKTKKNIELKLKNNMDVDQIILGKKKLKRSLTDRSNVAPLKCFELSSSGCDESSGTKQRTEHIIPTESATVPTHIPVKNVQNNITSAEKSIQTGDSIIETGNIIDLTEPAAEHFVSVDGGYLNILFHNLSQPQIFNSGKQYEVNEEALRNILNSANSQQHFNETDVLERFMNQIKNPDFESSSPSTARSLVEELDQYYKGFTPDDKSPIESPVQDSYALYEVKGMVQAADLHRYEFDNVPSAAVCESTVTLVDTENVFGIQRPCVCNVEESRSKDQGVVLAQTGPLPVPAGAVAGAESQMPDLTLWDATKTTNTQDSDSILNVDPSQNVPLLSAIVSPAQCEAEELRRQQLAIEREIKALEEQQCQLMMPVREIPDKPPPPYTPPSEPRAPRLSRMYVADETTEEKIQKYIIDPHTDSCDPTDPFDTFVKDFCIETLERQRPERSDRPWETCNLLPQKSDEDTEKLIKKTSNNLLEILTGGPPPPASSVGARRSDHIDDILFSEWRRCEAEWTSLHNDEVCVKNQIFESIFQKVLSETVDDYKKTVVCDRF